MANRSNSARRGRRTLVTGGAGFIGTHVAAALVAAGDDVVVLDSLDRAGDIRDCYADPTLARSLRGFEATMPLEEGMQSVLDWLRLQARTDRVDTAIAELSARGLAR